LNLGGGDSGKGPPGPGANAEPAGSLLKPRDDSAIYQNNRIVARVSDAQIDSEAREIRFEEVYDSTELLLPDECEFRDYRILVQRIGFASKEERGATHKGRTLRRVLAEILGYREQ
jgi:hypothetical protein